MKVGNWNVTASEAIKIQKELCSKVSQKNSFSKIRTVAGVDASYKGGQACAAIVVLSFPKLQVLEEVTAALPISFPYVPGLLTFREGPAVVAAYKKLKIKPDALVFDGQGIAHPRRLGIASHLGVLLDKPSVGCAKSILRGEASGALLNLKGASVPLIYKGEVLGAVVRSKADEDPLYVSVGHKIDLESAVHLVLGCVTNGHRLPLTTILAHNLSGSRPLAV